MDARFTGKEIFLNIPPNYRKTLACVGDDV
jgi:hypothetical protein